MHLVLLHLSRQRVKPKKSYLKTVIQVEIKFEKGIKLMDVELQQK